MTGCQASIFPFSVLHIDPELGGMFIFYALPHSIRAGPALPGVCHLLMSYHFWRLWQNLMLVFINAAHRDLLVGKAAEGATLMMRRGFQESRENLISKVSPVRPVQLPESRWAQQLGTQEREWTFSAQTWSAGLTPLLATSNSITKTILEFRKFLFGSGWIPQKQSPK